MRGLKAVSEETKLLQQLNGGRNIWVPLYYDHDKDTVYTREGKGRELVTHLLNEVSGSEIKDIVTRWLWR